MYGILLKTGGPNSLRPSTRVFRPPISTVPPSGTTTVVLRLMTDVDGCWKNSVKTCGCGGEILSNNSCGTICCTGNKGTVAEIKLDNVGVRLSRTKRRSAETTGVTVRKMP